LKLEVKIMKGVMIAWGRGAALCAFLAALVLPAMPAAAEPGRTDGPPAKSPRGLQFQEFEDPVEPLEPVHPRAASDEARIDSLAWFSTGRLLEHRGDLQGAFRAYQKAVERDPSATPVYRVLIPLAIQLRRIEDAVKWATRAAELNPADRQFVSQAVLLLDKVGNRAGAIRVLDQAAGAAGVDKHSPYYVNVMRDLAIMHLNTDPPNVAAAASAFEVVFDALVHPDAYNLDARMRSTLQKDSEASFEKIGAVFLEAKRADLALAAFKKAAETKKGAAAGGLGFNLAQVYVQTGEFEKALDELQKYIDAQRNAKGRPAYELFAEVLAKLNKSDELIPRLKAAAEKDARNSALLFFLADQYAAANRLDEAEALYLKTLETAAEVPGYVGLAGVYRRQNRPADLLETLAKAYSEAGELKPLAAEFKAVADDEKLLDKLLKSGEELLAEQPSPLDFPTGYVLANLAADGKKSDLAERLYRFLLTLRKDRADTIFEELGGHFIEVKKYAEASKIYLEAADDADLADKRPNFLFLATQALEMSGNTKAALEAIAAAQELIPNNPLLRFQEAWVYYHSHQFDEAIERMEKLIADFPDSQARPIIRRAQYSLSNAYVLKGDVRKGEEILEEIYKENPEDTSVNNDLGYLYADQGKNLEQAESMIRKALAAEPDNGAYLDSLGWVLFKRGKFDEALPYLEKAVKNSPGAGDETLWEHLGDVYDSLRQPAKAVEAWKSALEYADKASLPDKKLIERVKEKVAGPGKEKGK
jgi:tetratricopeptide (TPR) repeat protein